MANIPVTGPPKWWRALILWALIQVMGAVLFVLSLSKFLVTPTTNGNEPLDNMGYGFAVAWIIQWVLTYGFVYALPLLVLLPLGISLAFKHPIHRTWKLLGVVLGLELGVVAGEAWELSAHPTIFLGKIVWWQALPVMATIALPYILTALLLAWLLCRPWLRKPALQPPA